MSEKEIVRLTGPRAEPLNGGKPESLVIFCHGYGSNGEDLIGLSSQWAKRLPGTLFVAPNAPETMPMAPGGYQWFPLSTLSREERLTGTLLAAPVLNNFIDEMLAETGLDESRLVLAGFSQGTMMSLHVGPRREKQLAGILGYSGALTAPELLVAEVKTKPPVLLIHGDRDTVVHFPMMFEAKGALEAAGFDVDCHLSSGTAHGIAPDGLQKGGAFLTQALK